MRAIIKPSRAKGTIAAPPSKSMAHRMLICAGLAKGTSIVNGIAPSQDVLATLDCLEALGATYTYEKECVTITGADLKHTDAAPVLNCRECGSTLRFFIPIALLTNTDVALTGSETLMSRPLSVYEEICSKKGYRFAREEGKIYVKGCLDGDDYEVQGNISSQFISGLLFALPMLENDSRICLIPPVESRSYINMTIQALKEFQIEIRWEDENTLFVKGGQEYQARTVPVEGDYSNAAFFEALNLAGGEVTVTGLREDSLQGDQVYTDYFAKIRSGEARIAQGGTALDISNCPDLGPILFAAAAMCGGADFTGTKRLKIKESDRGTAMQQELAKFGICVECQENDIRVLPGKLQRPAEVLAGHNDHRIVMALSVLGTITGAEIDEAQAVRKSFPDFFTRLKEVQIEVETDGMDQ